MVKVSTYKNVADILHEKGLISESDLNSLKLEQVNTGQAIEDLIAQKELVNPKQLAEAKAEFLNTPFIELSKDEEVAPEVLEYVEKSTALRYILIPFNKQGEVLSVAMADPLDLQVIEFLEKKTKLKIKPYLAESQNILETIEEQYGKSLGTEVTAALEEAEGGTLKLEEKEEIDVEKVKEETIRSAPVAKIVNALLQYAVKAKASDIHIEPAENATRVRFRVDGVLHEKLTFPKKLHSSVVSRVKILSALKIDERRVPQDGRFKIEVGKHQVDLRVSTLPTSIGEKVVIRLLEEKGRIPELSELGLRGVSIKRLEENLRRPNGIILVTGPTGSGKTLTLASALSKINTVRVNIITLEDPVEIAIPGVNQVQINPSAGLTFASGLRSILRQDPNIIMVGEIRDNETASLAIHAALTGHLVFSTLHTNSAAGALPRLMDMEVEPFLLTSTVNCVEAQRLVRKICEGCKESYEAPEAMEQEIKAVLGNLYKSATKKIGKNDNLYLYRGKGCEKCADTGYEGRTGIFEVLVSSDTIARMVLEHKPTQEIEDRAVEEGMITLLQDGFLKALEGITTVEEVLRVAKE